MISIIIPAYNAASTLKDCINSILESDNGNIDYEIIIVNDGSTDETDSIGQILAKNNSQINYFSTPNRGVSSARNYGLYHAIGEYICFVDADDKVLPEYLSEISLNACKADITFFGFKKHIVATEETLNMDFQKVNPVSDRKEIEDEMFRLINNSIANLFGFTWSKVFRMDIIKKYGVSFNQNLKIKEDEIFTLEYCRHISTLQVIEKQLYYYNIYNTSLSHSNTQIRYDILMDEYEKYGLSATSDKLRDALLSLSISYGLGYVKFLKHIKKTKTEALRTLNNRIIPLVVRGHGMNSARWIPYVNSYVPFKFKANVVYLFL